MNDMMLIIMNIKPKLINFVYYVVNILEYYLQLDLSKYNII